MLEMNHRWLKLARLSHVPDLIAYSLIYSSLINASSYYLFWDHFIET